MRFDDYARGLLSQGRLTFTREEGAAALGMSAHTFVVTAKRAAKRGTVIMPRNGFYVVVPPQFATWGAPPPSWYIDDLMRHEGAPYYVGLLKAAEMHGASHQAAMEFQVVTPKRIPSLLAGRSPIRFYHRPSLEGLLAPDAGFVERRNTETGYVTVAGPELTALDVLRYPAASAGLENAATVIVELGRRLEPSKLVSLIPYFERVIVQRLGYLLDLAGRREAADALHGALGSEPRWAELDPAESGEFASDPVERNNRWRLVVRRILEVDADDTDGPSDGVVGGGPVA